MNSIHFPASGRGSANYGWLKTHYSFSFADYYDPKKIHFGLLRVFNDDWIAPGKGFGLHPHDNMEIITLPLKGTVEHTDSMGNKQQISAGEIQVMSAGSGIQHSEYNPHSDKELELLQIWVFPRQRNLKPRYEKTNIKDLEKRNELYTIVSPFPGNSGNWIDQDAWFQLGKYDSGSKLEYTIQKSGNGIYFFVIEGKIKIEDRILNKRDALGIWDSEIFSIEITEDSYFLIIDLPMHS